MFDRFLFTLHCREHIKVSLSYSKMFSQIDFNSPIFNNSPWCVWHIDKSRHCNIIIGNFGSLGNIQKAILQNSFEMTSSDWHRNKPIWKICTGKLATGRGSRYVRCVGGEKTNISMLCWRPSFPSVGHYFDEYICLVVLPLPFLYFPFLFGNRNSFYLWSNPLLCTASVRRMLQNRGTGKVLKSTKKFRMPRTITKRKCSEHVQITWREEWGLLMFFCFPVAAILYVVTRPK